MAVCSLASGELCRAFHLEMTMPDAVDPWRPRITRVMSHGPVRSALSSLNLEVTRRRVPDGLLGVGAAPENETVPPGGKASGQNALPVDLLIVVKHMDLCLEFRGQLHELARRPEVQAVAVGELHLSTGDGRILTHRRLSRP